MRQAIEHRLLTGIGRKQEMMGCRPQQSKNGRTEQHSGEEMTHHRRLADAKHEFAEQPRQDDKSGDLSEQQCF